MDDRGETPSHDGESSTGLKRTSCLRSYALFLRILVLASNLLLLLYVHDSSRVGGTI